MKAKRTVAGTVLRVLLYTVLAVVLLPVLLTLILSLRPVQKMAVDKARKILYEKTGIDANIGRVRIDPLFSIALDDVLALENGQDTVLDIHRLRLETDIRALVDSTVRLDGFLLEGVNLDSRGLLGETRIKARLDKAEIRSDSTSIPGRYTLLNRLAVSGADVEFVQDSTEKEKTDGVFDWKADIPCMEITDVRFSMPRNGLEINVGKAFLDGSADIAAFAYNAGRLHLEDCSILVGGNRWNVDLLDACGSINGSLIDVPELSVRSGSVSLEGRAGMNTDDLAGTLEYEAEAALDGFELSDFIDLGKACSADGSLKISGRGFNPLEDGTKISLEAILDDLVWDKARLGKTSLKAEAGGGAAKGNVSTEGGWSEKAFNASADGDIDFDVRNLNTRKPSGRVVLDLSSAKFEKDSLSLNLEELLLTAATERNSTDIALSAPGLELSLEGRGHALNLVGQLQKLLQAVPGKLDSIDVKGILRASPIMIKGIDLDSLRAFFPDMTVKLQADRENPLTGLLSSKGMGFEEASIEASLNPEKGIRLEASTNGLSKDSLSVRSASSSLQQRGEVLDFVSRLAVPAQAGLPDISAALSGWFGTSDAELHLEAGTKVCDGVLNLSGISSEVGLVAEVSMRDGILSAQGKVNLDSLNYSGHDFGDRRLTFSMVPVKNQGYEIRADSDEIPLPLLKSFIPMDDLALEGAVEATMHARGPLDSLQISGEAVPLDASVTYKPLKAEFALSRDPIRLEGTDVLIDSLLISACDGSNAALKGRVSLNPLTLDLAVDSDRFKPAPLEKEDSCSYYGNVAASLAMRLKGTPDSLWLGGDVGILPETDVTYMLGKNNYAHARASGNVSLDFPIGGQIGLKGRVNVDGGEIKYSLPFYPLAPFTVDKGSHVDFNGPLSAMKLDVKASQKAKAMVSETGDRVKNVDFTVGLQVMNSLDDLTLHFFMEAPGNEDIQAEIDAMGADERDRIAAALLTTGMYTSESNEEASEASYALVSILQRGVNTLAGNMLGDIVDVDLGMGSSSEIEGQKSDYSMKLSKSFLDDRLKITVGGTLSTTTDYDSGEGSGASAFLDNVSAEFTLDKDRKTAITLFHKRDFENIMDGELNKEGIGVRTSLAWNDRRFPQHPFTLDLQGDVSYRSNMQIGPSLAATLSKHDMLGLDETVSARLHGAYYWKIQDRNGSSNDNFNIGTDIAMSVPDLIGESTRYNIGYQHENIAGVRRLDKISAGATHIFRPGMYTTHEFTPFSLSLVNSQTDLEYYEGMTIHSLIKDLTRDEYIPSVSYRFTYDNTSDRDRKVGTTFSASLKEAGNLIYGAQSLIGGYETTEYGRKFIFGPYAQFTKGTLELRNNFRLTQRSSIATRLFGGAVLSYGNTTSSPMSESFYAGGPSSIRAFAPRSIGPGGYYSELYNLNFYHAGDIRLEANIEYRFPLFWMLEGAVFVDAGNVWCQYNTQDELTDEVITILDILQIPYNYTDGLVWKELPEITALGTGFGLRLVYQSIVIRLDTGIAIHCPYNTGINSYYNIPDFWRDGIRLNFGIGYPF